MKNKTNTLYNKNNSTKNFCKKNISKKIDFT